jgi:uncharacterized membrane protein (UPF0136 family)
MEDRRATSCTGKAGFKRCSKLRLHLTANGLVNYWACTSSPGGFDYHIMGSDWTVAHLVVKKGQGGVVAMYSETSCKLTAAGSWRKPNLVTARRPWDVVQPPNIGFALFGSRGHMLGVSP